MQDKKLLIVISHDNFDDEEYFIVKESCVKANISVETASTHMSEAKGRSGATVIPDTEIKYVEAGDYDGFVFIGEESASEYYSNPDVLRIVSNAHVTGKLIAAIGKAVPILTYTGKLTNLLVTGDITDKSILEELGAYFSGHDVETSQNFITAAGPQAKKEFAEAIVSHISLESGGYLR